MQKQSHLAKFVGFLEDQSMIDTKAIQADSPDGFTNRLKLQKYVFLAKHCFGLDLGYEFNQYRYGPYSPRLADDYFELDKDGISQNHHSSFPGAFNKDHFLSTLRDKDETWLEVASTLVDTYKHYRTNDDLIGVVARIKPRYTRQQIEGVFTDLVHYGLIKGYQ